ncbi:MAG: branched-chain amino acid ABC transporter permease, partial [Gammaproteobacteria bacterium]|nr:branched-chain amino acid ABC transporter permease [Gammaproteobacteria bacterium]
MSTRPNQTQSRLSPPVLFGIMAAMIIAVGVMQSWSVAFSLINLCLISAIMALGVNIQWGYAGLFNVGVMGFAALGGVSVILVSMPPVAEAVQAGGGAIMAGALIILATVIAAAFTWKAVKHNKRSRYWVMSLVIAIGYFVMRYVVDPGTDAIEAVNPATTGYLGGFGLPVLVAWPVGALIAAGAAWVIGKVSLGLRSDYLAIATLGISEIVIYVLKNEEWLTRGVKNVNGLPRPVPYEIDLQGALWFQDWANRLGIPVDDASSLFVKIAFALLFIAVLAVLIWLSEVALKSPWGRMMRAIRDNETAAAAMGKNVTW